MTLRVTKQLTILNAHLLGERLAQPHTLCVTGHPRGGTSAVALFLRETGLFMGDDLIGFNHEDRPLQAARGDPAAFARIARGYDERHPMWGFKLPVGSRMARDLVPLLRNPVQLIVMRGAVATLRSRFARRGFDDEALFWQLFEQMHRDWIATAQQAQASEGPVIMVEYERLTADPRTFGAELAEELALAVPSETLDRAVGAISTPGYRRYSGDPDQTPLGVERAAMARKLFR